MSTTSPIPAHDRLTVYGTTWCGDCTRTKAYLSAAATPFVWVDLGVDDAAREMLHDAGYLAVPVVAIPGGQVLVEPSNDELAAALEAAGPLPGAAGS